MQNSEYLRALAYNEDDIIEDVIPTDIIPDLRSCKLFTEEDEQIVLHEITDKSKNRKLLDIIKNKGDELYEKFCEVLRTTNEDIAENLESQNFNRTRRYSNTEFGEIVVKGGVPNRNGDYVPRPKLEDTILNKIISNDRKPILIHGIVGCGKTSIVSNVLHSEKLFPSRFLTCCWMDVGNVQEKDINNKLLLLLKKLDPSPELPLNAIPEILIDRIKAKLFDRTTLLILDNIWDNNILKYFNFQNKYIVVSKQSNLTLDNAELINIPDGFEREECTQLMRYHDIDEYLFPKIISKSFRNPLYLSMICKLIYKNKDFIRVLNEESFNINQSDTILREYITVLDDELKSKYEMLAILEEGETLSLELLSYFWNVPCGKALNLVNKLCDFNFLHKTWNNVFETNLYGVYIIYLKYLEQNITSLQNFKQIFIDNYKAKYRKWLDIKEPDPFFLIFYGRTLFLNENFEKLIESYTDFSFIAAKIAICGIVNLQNEYEKYRPPDSNSGNWNDFEAFFMKYGHKFMMIPSVYKIPAKIGKVFINLIQLALYEPKTSAIYNSALRIKKECSWKDFWEWINPRNSIKVWEINHGDYITYFDVMKNLIVMSSDTNSLRILEFNTAKCLLNLKLPNPIILLKFISDHEFVIIYTNGEYWKFDLNSLLNSTNTDEDDEYDEVDQVVENDINSFREQFQNLSIDDFISKNFKISISNSKLDMPVQAYIFEETIVFLKSAENLSYVAYYDLKGRMKDDFEIPFSVKKIVFYPSYNGFYVLKEDSGQIFLYNEYGGKQSSIIIENQVIIDFVLKGNDIFCAASNNIYEQSELLLTLNNEVNIVQISISDNQTLLAICLTNDSVQIWNYNNKTLLYSLNDSQFTDVYFLHDSDFLLTTGSTNAAKWDLKNINLAKNDNNNNEFQLSLYRRHFGMHSQSPVSFLLVLQSVNNNIEFFSYENGTLNSRILNESFEMSCFNFYENIIFISFKGHGSIKVYDLTTYQQISEISGFVNVQEIYSHKTNSKNILELIVHHSKNKIRILHLFEDSFSTKKDISCELPNNSSNCKFFKYEADNVRLVSMCNTQCDLCDVNENIQLIKSYDFEYDVLDVDISVNCQYLCAISNNGEIKVWDIRNSLNWSNDDISNTNILRKCKFRPKISPDNWNVVAVINDKAIVSLFYFRENEEKLKILIDPYKTVATQIPNFIKWSIDGNYVLVGDYNIRKWKVTQEPLKKDENRLPLTILQTYFGGIQDIYLNEKFICTVDQQGFFYILKKIE